MILQFRKIFLNFTFNLCLFLILIIGIQNSSEKRKVNLIIRDTIRLPVSFIVGVSFISGSLVGSLLLLNPKKDIN
ncbi:MULTISPECIES: hypothetical protein [Prochlorococcus]|uniref:hypothetical protein n=1 Tax=Prochlorococcus TaxID=1218 RepID=UPI000515FE65|nr:hypothetical protein [Prochlorococcus marinus]